MAESNARRLNNAEPTVFVDDVRFHAGRNAVKQWINGHCRGHRGTHTPAASSAPYLPLHTYAWQDLVIAGATLGRAQFNKSVPNASGV